MSSETIIAIIIATIAIIPGFIAIFKVQKQDLESRNELYKMQSDMRFESLQNVVARIMENTSPKIQYIPNGKRCAYCNRITDKDKEYCDGCGAPLIWVKE